MNISEMKHLYKSGVPVSVIMARAGIEDGDAAYIKRVLSANGKPKRRTTRASRSKRSHHASQVLARGYAMAELVSRVNQAAAPAPAMAEIPFDGMCEDYETEIISRDFYGV